MTGKDRRKAIQKLLTTKGNLSASEIAEHFSVSRMTIHRDLKALENAGELRRIHGGAVTTARPEQSSLPDICNTCHEPALPHQRYLRHCVDQSSEVFCCASCGVKAQLQLAAPGIFYATDMISGKILPAEDAYFLIRSSASPCCQPSILTFADEVEASTFRSSFGGVLGRINDALNFLQTEQALEKSH